MYHSYSSSALSAFMVLPQAHHILPSLSTSSTLQNLSAQFGLTTKWGIMIFLKSCHARKDVSLRAKQKQKNRKMNVRFRAEDQGNFHVVYIHPFEGISALTSKMHKQSQAKCKSLSQAKEITAGMFGDRSRAHPLRLCVGAWAQGSVHMSVSVHGCMPALRLACPGRRCAPTTHAYVQHICVSRHVENHTHTHWKEHI